MERGYARRDDTTHARHEIALRRISIALVLVCAYLSIAVVDAAASIRTGSLSTIVNDGGDQHVNDAVFCSDMAVEIAFPSRNGEIMMGDTVEMDDVQQDNTVDSVNGAKTTASGCVRHPLMIAIVNHMKPQLKMFAVNAIDCVMEPLDEEASSISLFAIISICSRSNIVQDAAIGIDAWHTELKQQLTTVFAPSHEQQTRVEFGQTVGYLRRTAIAPSYQLPNGNGVPKFKLNGVEIWSEGDGDVETDMNTDQQSFFTYVKLGVKNKGNVPLHLYQITLTAATDASNSLGFEAVLPLVTPAVVDPFQDQILTFKATTSGSIESIAPSSGLVMYVSHNGFRSHRFQGTMDGRTLRAFETDTKGIKFRKGINDEVFPFTVDSVAEQSFFMTFPYASWRVFSIGIVFLVGIIVALFMKRKLPRLQTCICGLGRPKNNAMGHSTSQHGKTSDIYSPKKSDGLTINTVNNNNRSSSPSHKKVKEVEMKSLVPSTSLSSKRLAQVPSTLKQEEYAELYQAEKFSFAFSNMPLLFFVDFARMPPIAMQWKRPTPRSDPLKNTRRRLDLDGTTVLHPKRFESMWDEYIQRFESNTTSEERPDASGLISKMESIGITCMASGTVNVDITTATNNISTTVRTSSDVGENLVQDFIALIQEATKSSSWNIS